MSDDVVESSPKSTQRKSDDNSTPKKKKSKKRRRRSGGNSPSTQDGGSDRQASPSSSISRGGGIRASEVETGVSSANGSPAESDTLVETKEKVCLIISYVTALFHTVYFNNHTPYPSLHFLG